MGKLKLENVTAIAIDTILARRAEESLLKSMEQVDFGSVKLLTDGANLMRGLYKVPVYVIPLIHGKQNYSHFMMYKLNDFVDTDYCLIIQWDGFVWSADGWRDEFYNYDYIGAPWYWDKVVGNGGFSFRSKKLLEVCASAKHFKRYHPEDAIICREERKWFEEQGIKYAPLEVAYQFAVEHEPYTGQFGFHGGKQPRL